ncbi:hypothetical protein TraAM80_08688 [Trypanosoma rangeli]|uniref:Surface protease GP63 n=1 Tax=Trypanosoma rangeli TaxID=5698 RepID=A0A422MZG3_TRYRA|nr:uncharacterized protein TraAM80_08688 [Trypanosoma rangeli]RNE98618.1 hypothetical protein TraAM80_08688 [Trypanosoma rangeli]|eukprot:RNE98618.1 hypothetical protein TraAM80_08688 [Trypanosoma rangeli]
MMMTTVRRRAVCALVVLALLCGCCSFVCGATHEAKEKAKRGAGEGGKAVLQAAFQDSGASLSHRWDFPPVPVGGGASVGKQSQRPVLQSNPRTPAQGNAVTDPCCAQDCDVRVPGRPPCLPYAASFAGQPYAAGGTSGQTPSAYPPAPHLHNVKGVGGQTPFTPTTTGRSGTENSMPTAAGPAGAVGASGKQHPPIAASYSETGIAGLSLSTERDPLPSQGRHSPPDGIAFPPQQNYGGPAFSNLHGGDAEGGGGFPGAALVGRHFVPPRTIAGKPSDEGAANQQNAGRTAEGEANAKVGEAGDVTRNSGPVAVTGPGSNNEGGQASAAAVAGTALSVQTNSQSSAEGGATREVAASGSQEPSSASPSGPGTPAGATQENSRTGAADAGGAHSGGAGNATSAFAARNNSRGDLLPTRAAEDDTVCGRRVLPTLLLLGLWVFAAM